MNTIEIARRLAECGEKAEAQRAYTLALQAADLSPEEELEAASYLLFSKGDSGSPIPASCPSTAGAAFRQSCWS